MSLLYCGAYFALRYKFVGGKFCLGPEKCGGMNEGSMNLWVKFAPKIHGAMLTLPAKIRGQSKLLPARSRRHSFIDQQNYLKILKYTFLDFFMVFVNHLHFRNLYNQYDHFG